MTVENLGLAITWYDLSAVWSGFLAIKDSFTAFLNGKFGYYLLILRHIEACLSRREGQLVGRIPPFDNERLRRIALIADGDPPGLPKAVLFGRECTGEIRIRVDCKNQAAFNKIRRVLMAADA